MIIEINTSENEAKLTNGYDRLHFVVLLRNEHFNQHFKNDTKSFKDKIAFSNSPKFN